jgi:hypothetical protein
MNEQEVETTQTTDAPSTLSGAEANGGEMRSSPPPAVLAPRWLWVIGVGGLAVVALVVFAAWAWMQRGAKPASGTVAVQPVAPREPLRGNSVDDFVFGQLARLGVTPAGRCSDEVFFRRAYLDVIGCLPTAAEARAFFGSQQADKRAELIDTLLERDEFADYWAMKWGDLLRIKAEFPVNLWPNAAQVYHQWVRAAMAENRPYDRFARELLTSSGSNFRVGPANFYRAMQNRTPEGIAATVALTFMGTRAETWPPERLVGMAGFFSQVGYKPSREWKEEIVFWDPLGTTQATNSTATPASLEPVAAGLTAVFPDGRQVTLPPDRDPREVFADWLIMPKNPWFTRNIVNRVWSWLMGRGIVSPADDMRETNPAANPELLAFLEQELIKAKYDLKQLYRLILNSRAYQLASRPEAAPDDVAAAHFASYPQRRLEAEVLIDALNQITGTTELYTSPIPEPFTYIPTNTPAVALADGSITSPFLALFGRSARATGLEDERNNQVLPAQMLHLLNSSHVGRKLEQGPGLRAIIDSGRERSQILDELYLTTLSRYPRPGEATAALAYAAPGGAPGSRAGAGPATPRKQREAWVDIAWALVNSDEFLFRH